MDSLTHTVLGACLGEAIAGKQLGKKAMLIGALANNLPDIDVLTAFWTGTVEELLVHRGITHSILFALVVSPLLAFMFYRFSKNGSASYKRWLVLISSGLFLHILMDAFTTYGTGWFEPFSHHRVTFNTLFIADPFFALPLLVVSIILLILRKTSSRRKGIAVTALGISLLYLLTTIGIKLFVDSVIEKDLDSKKIVHQEFMASPTPLNNLLWYAITKSDDHFYIGYYSVFDKEKTLHWERFKKNDSLLEPIKDQNDIKLLKRFSKDYYCIRKVDSTINFSDIRFGQIGGWYIPQAPFVFNFDLLVSKRNILGLQRGRFESFNSNDMKLLVRRIEGE